MPSYKRKVTRVKPKRKMYKRKMKYLRKPVTQIVKSLAEKKLHTIEVTNQVIDWDGTIINISEIAQGSTVNEREGNQVQLSSVGYNIISKNFDVNNSATVSIILFTDTQQDPSTNPTVTEVLHGVGDNRAPVSPLNHAEAGRFKLLSRKTFNVGDLGSGLDHHLSKYFKRLNTRVRYRSTTGTSIQKNGLYLLLITDRDPAATDEVELRGFIRLYWTDL